MKQIQNIFKRMTEIRPLHASRRFLRHGANARDDFAGAMAIMNDPPGGQTRLLDVRMSLLQPPQTGPSIGHDRHKGLIDLMGNGDCKFADRRHSGDLGELGLALAQ